MSKEGFINIIENTFDIDIKPEVKAAELIESGLPIDQAIIWMLGSLKRSYRKDVEDISSELSEKDNREYVHITTHKEGIYDMLPQFIFHTPTLARKTGNTQESKEASKKRRLEEMNARKFFLPFEAAINNMRIRMALYENRLDKSSDHSDLREIFGMHWAIFNYLDTHQSHLFLQILPFIHDMREDLTAAASVFEIILGLPVQIYTAPEESIIVQNPEMIPLSECYLGINFTTGNQVFHSCDDRIIIELGPLTKEELQRVTTGGQTQILIEMLCDYFINASSEVTFKFEPKEEVKSFQIFEVDSPFNPSLGGSTYL